MSKGELRRGLEITDRMSLYDLDHVIIFVKDLEATENAFAEHLGFQITSHADHPGFGTRNAAIAFQHGFLELLTTRDEAEMRATRYARLFLDRHAARGDNPTIYVFRTSSLDAVISACKARGGICEDRMIGYSRMHGGPTRKWECAFMPGTEPVFLDPRLPNVGGPREGPAKTPGTHPNGAQRLAGVVIAVKDLPSALALYSVQLGLGDPRIEEHSDAHVAWISLPDTNQSIALAEPRRSGHDLAGYVSGVGEGIYGIILGVDDVDRATAQLDRRRTAYQRPAWLKGLPVTDAGIAASTRLVLIKA
jgi:catechol 2,3-dioxygenase-like lactoylglutathione lyase family enzyme